MKLFCSSLLTFIMLAGVSLSETEAPLPGGGYAAGLTFLDEASFSFSVVFDSASISLSSPIPQPRDTHPTQPCGDPEAWAPHLWPAPLPKLAERDGDKIEVELSVKNLGFVDAVRPTLTLDKITDAGRLVQHSIGGAIEVAPALGPGQSAVVRVPISLLSVKGSLGVVFHLNCSDSAGYPHSFGDGKRPIVFVSDRDGDWDIFVMNPDGTGQKNLTRDQSENAWEDFGILSPDGKQILFDRIVPGREPTMWIMNVDGSNARRVSPEGYGGRYGSWAPSGRKFCYGMMARRGEAPPKVATLRPDGSALRLLPETEGRGGLEGAYSPEGGRLVFVSGEGIPPRNKQFYLMDSDGVNIRPIAGTEVDASFPAWSPEGDRVVVRRTAKRVPEFEGLWSTPYQNLIIYNVDGSGEANVSPQEEAIDWDPFWSPSGSLLIFSSTGTLRGLMELWLVRANDGRRRMRLTICDGEFRLNRGAPSGDWYPMWFGK